MTEHHPTLFAGEITCSCGWESGFYVMPADAIGAWMDHLASTITDREEALS